QAGLAAAKAALTQATSNLSAAQGARLANTALIADADIVSNPEVIAAQARLDAAKLALSRTTLRAPTDGVISRKNVEVGQQVQVGQPLMVVVPLSTAFVDANFKEVELKKVAPGQPVELTSDLYGDGVKFHGHVVGFAGGTGSAFSLIPAQNASGNWIKVVQRLPVRIQLDPAELQKHPLRVGLSMKATIDVSQQPQH
ncbi:MAG TPA: HlyD family secretion protein, partial [Hyphomonadaceae bacterium]|nr:HlyD family secretion protein [Hyphomonadaceae bacterium]